jgi:TRAP-type mannitol/chloroaromatic compound transport system permease large subunit
MRKEVWFGISIMGLVVIGLFLVLPSPANMTNGHLGLLMLGLIVVAIMLGFPTAFTLMGMGVVFAWMAYRSVNPDLAVMQTLDLMVQRTYAVMANDVLISVPLFVFMGYLVERANLIDKLFRGLQLAMVRLPGSLAVATIVTCAIFATATGIVGAVVTLMGLLALPAMLKAGYDVRLSAGAITAGGCLGILIPPSILLIVYGATAGVSVVQLYAGAFFPGLMLTALYLGYVIILAKINPRLAPSLSEEDRKVPLPPYAQSITDRGSSNALAGLLGAIKGRRNADVPMRTLLFQLFITLLPALVFATAMGATYNAVTTPEAVEDYGALELGSTMYDPGRFGGGLAEPPMEEAPDEGLSELGDPQSDPLGAALEEPVGKPLSEPLDEPKEMGLEEPPGAPAAENTAEASGAEAASAEQAGQPAPASYWIAFGIGLAALILFYGMLSFVRLEIFKLLLSSFFPLAILIMAVLGAIVFGLATPTEAAAMGSLGGLMLAAAYRRLNFPMLKESVFLAAKTTAMVCWLFVGSSIFSAAFALLGGQELINNWVMSMDMTPLQFMILAQIIIFLLGWPLEWTEIIVIFMPIFIPLLAHFNVDPLFFGLLVAINLQTAFLSPPVAMSAFYLKGVAPPHVTLNQIFLGMMPYMVIQIVALFLLYTFPAIGLWLPQLLYK